MVLLKDKDCKKYITKLEKLLNALIRYNIEQIHLMQIIISKKDDKFIIDPVIMCIPSKINMFDFLKIITKENLLNNDKIKTSRDINTYSPIIFGSLYNTSFNSDENSYSQTYFIVIDLFKVFIKNNTISMIDDEFNMYDENGDKYNTTGFLYKNDFILDEYISKKVNPKYILPIKSKLNERYEQELIPNKYLDMILISSKKIPENKVDNTLLDVILKTIKEKTKYSLNINGNIIDIFPDVIKIKPEEMYITIFPNTNSIKEICLQFTSKDYTMYILYKYYE
jgi:hypothetical protein